MNRTILVTGLSLLAAGTLSSAANADVYTDATGDIFDAGLVNLDIVSVSMTNDATFLYFDLTVADLNADWGKYLLLIDSGPGGDTANPWGRDIDTNGVGLDAFMGSWIDGGGGAISYTYDGAWNDNGTTTPAIDFGLSTISYALPLTSLGLAAGQSFFFDVASTGGGDGDPAIDLLSTDVTQPGWGQGSTIGTMLEYHVVPAPSVLAAFSVLALVGSRRRR